MPDRYTYVTMRCEKCDGELRFQCEPPDYSVGLMGYACILLDKRDQDCQCHFTEAEVDNLEMQASMQAAEPREPIV